MKKIVAIFLLCLPLAGGSLLLPMEEGYARDRSERWDDRRGVRRAYAAGAASAYRRDRRHERRERHYDRREREERRERRERREDRRDAARAAIAIGAAAAIINATRY